jgi:hypothetical protein
MRFAPAPITAPVPFAALRLAFAALRARAEEIGVFVFGGMLDYYLCRKLERKLAEIIADLRIAVLHRAFELVPTLRAYRPRPLPEPAPFDDDAAPEVEDSDGDLLSKPAHEPNAIRPMGVNLWPVGRQGQDNSANRQPYYWMPETVPTRRLAGRLQAVERVLADVDRYARRLARLLTRPPRALRHRPDLGADAQPLPVSAEALLGSNAAATALGGADTS